MGTETFETIILLLLKLSIFVKLNNPLMGTETPCTQYRTYQNGQAC